MRAPCKCSCHLFLTIPSKRLLGPISGHISWDMQKQVKNLPDGKRWTEVLPQQVNT